MKLIEKLLNIIAPPECIGCGSEGVALCGPCDSKYFKEVQSICAFCGVTTIFSATCSICRVDNPLNNVWFSASYEGLAKDIVKALKFDGKRFVAESMAQQMIGCLPGKFAKFTVVPAPTSPRRSRERGFDQAKLIAREISRLKNIDYQELLARSANTRQVGADRETRQAQMRDSFICTQDNLRGRKILLLDDVMTTGATLSAAARTLKRCGAGVICAVVFARDS